MSTTAQTQPAKAQTPNITIITRMASIPMISLGLGTINDALITNAYTRSPYIHAKALSNTAYNCTEPLQFVLAPIIVKADGIANMAVDAVESRYPYPFKVQPDEFAALARQSRQDTTAYVHERVNNMNKAIDEKVRTPACNVASNIDMRFAPVVDYFEGAFCRLNGKSVPSNRSDTQYQYQRAFELSKTFGDTMYIYSSDQLKHVRDQSVLLQKASETAQSITAATSSSLASAHSGVVSLSNSMLAELNKLQQSVASLSASLPATLQNSTSQIQSQISQIPQSYAAISDALSSTVNEITSIITDKDLALQAKVGCLGREVRERVQPLLDSVMKGVSEVLSRSGQVDVLDGNGVNGGR